eukprot:jgi/Orpsp1_1/1180220/evm.model.c7180000072544.1
MINSKDLKAFTKQILNVDDDYEDLNDYDVNHLDYQYIEKCSDIKELKKLLKILKSGKEGYFLQMEDAIQKKLEYLDPSLKQEPLPKKEDIDNELNDWVNMLKQKDQKLKKSSNKELKSIFSKNDNEKLIINELTFNTEEPSETINKKKNISHTNNEKKHFNERIKSTDYRKWDLYNVDEEVKKLDNEDNNDNNIQENNNDNHNLERKKRIENYSRRLNKEKHIPAVSMDIKQKNQEELKVLAEIEKNKGNDCYKSRDYEEALIYYTRSLDLMEMPNVYTNRALVNIKLSRFSEAENDATEALRMNDPKFNFKAYLRRGESFSRRARYREAINDFSEALKLDPSNKEAENLLIKAQQKYLEVEGELAEKLDTKIKESKKPKKKMLIKEVDEIKEDDTLKSNTEEEKKDKKNNNQTIINYINQNLNRKENIMLANINNNMNEKSINNIVNDNDNEYANSLNTNDINILSDEEEEEEAKDINNIVHDNDFQKFNNIIHNNDKENVNSLIMNDINILSEEEEEEEEKEEKNINNIVHDNDFQNFINIYNNDKENDNSIIMNDINILSEEEEEENTEYSNFSDVEENNNNIENIKEFNKKKGMMKSYIESLKFYNESESGDENINSFNEEEIRKKLEKLNELKKYVNNSYYTNGNNSDEDIEINNINEMDGEKIEDDNSENEDDIKDGYYDEEMNYMEFLKAKEKERFDLYEKTMNNYTTDFDDDLNEIYSSEDDDEILKIINNQLIQGNLNKDEKIYITQLLKNQRSQASLGSDNSDFDNYEYESSN